MILKEIALFPLYKMFEFPVIYHLTQQIGRPTTDRYRNLITQNLPSASGKCILDLGCGVGAFRDCFSQSYTGIDINPAYVERARSTLPGRFETMDCTDLQFPDASFDEVVTIATTHHLNDEQVLKTIHEALRVCRPDGQFHIVDAILPVSANFVFKTLWFRLDRGRFPRQLPHLLALARRAGNVLHDEVLTGPLHDIVYIRVART
jgi:ubiquinone/menaquinone biosynthesis C-methylase UbiE